ncbi:MAG: DUF3617 domain-containing protein [Magnetococcus sp. YQC-5]
MRIFTLVVFAATLSCGTTAQSAEISAKEGLYDISIQTEMPGMPMPAQKVRQCITEADRRDPQKLMQQGTTGDDCAMKNIKQESNKLSFAMSCPKEHLTGQGDYHFANDSYTGVMTMTMPNPGGGATHDHDHKNVRQMGWSVQVR